MVYIFALVGFIAGVVSKSLLTSVETVEELQIADFSYDETAIWANHELFSAEWDVLVNIKRGDVIKVRVRSIPFVTRMIVGYANG